MLQSFQYYVFAKGGFVMNFDILSRSIASFDDILLIGKTAQCRSSLLDVIGAVLKDGEVRLFAVQYDEGWYERKQELEELAASGQLCEMSEETNRDTILNERRFSNDIQNIAVRRITAGDSAFDISSSGGTLLSGVPMDVTLILVEFLKLGYTPCDAIRHRDFDYIYLVSFELNGKFDKIPPELASSPLMFSVMPDSKTCGTDKKLALEINGKYPDTISFADSDSGEKHSFFIENVALSDIWEDLEKQFSDPRIANAAPPEQLERARRHMTASLSALCPRGMRLPVIEYYAPDGISLEFFLTEYLDSPIRTGRASFCGGAGEANAAGGSDGPDGAAAVGIIGGSDGPTAVIISSSPDKDERRDGMKLRCATIQTPVPADTKNISVEMLRYYKMTPGYEITV